MGNLNGEYRPQGANHPTKTAAGTFGKPKGALKPDVTGFRKKGTGTMHLTDKKDGKQQQGSTVSVQKFHYNDEFKKENVPKKADKPIMGLVSDKNYIVANAVENILAAPKMPTNKDKDFLKKRNYGKCPQFLQKIKNEIEDEY